MFNSKPDTKVGRPIEIPCPKSKPRNITPFDHGSPPLPSSSLYAPSSRVPSFSQPVHSSASFKPFSPSSRVPSGAPLAVPSSRTRSNPVRQTGFSCDPSPPACFRPVHQTGFSYDPSLDDVTPARMSFSNLSDACLDLSQFSGSLLSPELTPASTPDLSSAYFGGFEQGFDLNDSSYHCLGPVEEGVGGVYLVRNINTGALRVFKPTQEEGFEEDETMCKAPLRNGVEYGECTLKEIAAYLLDHDKFAGVPCTEMAFVTVEGVSQQGTLQDYVAHTASCEDHGNSHFTPEQVHRIGLLDLRLLNLDRHLGNILVTSKKTLVPIDHGYVLPSYEELGDVAFEWLYWHQCKKPFDDEAKEYVGNLDPLTDARILRELGLGEESIIAQFCATVFVKRAVAKGLTLFQMADMVQRSDGITPSPVEKLLQATGPKAVGPFDTDPVFLKELCAAIDKILPVVSA